MIRKDEPIGRGLMLVLVIIAFTCSRTLATEVEELTTLTVKPSLTDARIVNADDPHLIMYQRSHTSNSQKLFLFLPGTNGIPLKGPKMLFNAALEKGHKVINLAYINKQAVARICKGETLAKDEYCTSKFRAKRIFGEGDFALIPDEPQDAIVNRLTKLLVYLSQNDEAGNWGKYLQNGEPNWQEIILTGQSQGGGMAAFIAQRVKVFKIVSFSGGWDYSSLGKIAHWYSNESVTPAERWYATYHAKEPAAEVLAKTYEALGIPPSQTFRLDKPIREGKRAHGEAIRNIIYTPMWLAIF